MTIDAVTGGATITSTWGNSVADQLNDLPPGLVFGRLTGTTDATGLLTITFGVTFSAAPVVIASRESANAVSPSDCFVVAGSITTTTAQVRLFSAGTRQDSTAGQTVVWAAFGAIA